MRETVKNNRWKLFIISAILLVYASSMSSTGYCSRPDIKVGMSAALSGPSQSLGIEMKLGIETYFAKINHEGGIRERKLKLIALDDGYEPEAALRNMHTLIDKERVVAVLGNVGTPTAMATIPIAKKKRTLLFGPFTGAGICREVPPSRYVINYRASYAEETAEMVRGLLKRGILPYEIAFFSQNDSYGDAGYLDGGLPALKAAGFFHPERLAHGRYERNTVDIEEGLLTILESPVKPRAIIMIGAYAPCAKFIRIAKRELPGTLFLNVSFVGSTALARELGEYGDGVIVTQVVPHFRSELPLVSAYLKDLESFFPGNAPGFVSLEGYIVGKLFVEGLRSIKAEITRESIIDAILAIRDLDIGLGISVGFGNGIHQASHKVWPTVIRQGKFYPLSW